MKKLALGVGAVALALAPVGVANATGGSTPTNYISISPYADYDYTGTNIDIGLQVRCKAGLGTGAVNVVLQQSPPETPYPVSVGDGGNLVVCDGKTHSVAATVIGVGFDAGRAKVSATLMSELLTPLTTKTQTVTIRQ